MSFKNSMITPMVFVGHLGMVEFLRFHHSPNVSHQQDKLGTPFTFSVVATNLPTSKLSALVQYHRCLHRHPQRPQGKTKKIITCKKRTVGNLKKTKPPGKGEKKTSTKGSSIFIGSVSWCNRAPGPCPVPLFPAPHLLKAKEARGMAKFTCHSQIAPATWGNGIFNRAFPEPSKEQSTKTGANGWVFPFISRHTSTWITQNSVNPRFPCLPKLFFSSFSCYTNVKCRNERQRPLWFCQAPTKQTRNQLPTTKKKQKETPGCQKSDAKKPGACPNSPRDSSCISKRKICTKLRGKPACATKNLSASRYFQLWQHKKMLQNQFIALRKGTY